VKSPNYYEPELNPSYQDLAEHYHIAVLPARVRKPRDKPHAENGVQNVERSVPSAAPAAVRMRRLLGCILWKIVISTVLMVCSVNALIAEICERHSSL